MGVGLLAISGAAVFGARSPVELTTIASDEMLAQSPALQEASGQSYTQRVRQRQRDAALVGGVAGTAVGALALFVFVSLVPATKAVPDYPGLRR